MSTKRANEVVVRTLDVRHHKNGINTEQYTYTIWRGPDALHYACQTIHCVFNKIYLIITVSVINTCTTYIRVRVNTVV